jgi:hypothetical protein
MFSFCENIDSINDTLYGSMDQLYIELISGIFF